MKVLHINTEQMGGAAWCAIRINKALANIGIESRMLFANGESMPDGLEGAIAEQDKEFWYSNPVLGKIKHLLMRTPWYWDKEKADMLMQRELAKVKDRPYTHHPFSYYKNIVHHPLVEWADIIHLHWVSDFVDYPSFFKEVKKPIVWTLHDKYPAVGILHYSSEFFPVLDELKCLDEKFRSVKRKGVKEAWNLHLVAISKSMIDLCKKSDVLKNLPVTLIHNGVDTLTFTSYDKMASRKELGLSQDATIFLFSAYGIVDRNKGLERLIAAIKKVNVPNKVIVCIGNDEGYSIPKTSFTIKLAGLQKDQAMIAKYYSASDFFMQCSYEESFGQTVLEAMSCGTPVISTPVGIAPDLIQPFNGVMCKGYDAEAIADGIRKALNMGYDSFAIRQYIVDNYEYNIIAEQYKALYEELMG